MANRITIRRGTNTPTANDLLPYELGWSTQDGKLYINNNGTIIPLNIDAVTATYDSATETLTLNNISLISS